MQNTPVSRVPQRRGPVGPARRKKRSVLPSLLLLAMVLTLLVAVFPKEPLTRAASSAQGGDAGTVGSASSAYKGLKISEIMAANSASVPDEKGEYPDWVEIWNSSDQPIDLTDVGLSDRPDRVRFLFPAVTLKAGGRVVVFASGTNKADPNGEFHAKFKISSAGNTVYLFDPEAYIVDQVTTPILNTDVSYIMEEDGTFAVTQEYSPGFENTHEGFLAYRDSNAVTDSALRINEIVADARTGLADEDNEMSDWIELYNTTDKNISLDNYALSDKENQPLKWRFPAGAMVPAKGYYLVFASGKDRHLSLDKISHTNFRISAERETILLSDSRGRLVDRVVIDNLAADCSYGRNDSGNWQVFQTATPGMPNNAAGAAQAEKNLLAANKTGVYISEVISSGPGKGDKVELYNSSTQTVSLEKYGLSDSIDRPRKWQFPAGAAIFPGEYKVISLDGTNTSVDGYHTNFKLARAGGETMVFATPDGRVLDKIPLPLIPTGNSYGRTAGLNGFFYYDAPTMGAANGTGFIGFAAVPSFSIKGGIFKDTVNVSINIPEGTTVRYTTDGATPTEASQVYDGSPLELSNVTVLRARAFQPDLQPSDTVTQTYFVNVYHSLPIVSLVTDPDTLWNDKTGMFAVGGTLNKAKIPFTVLETGKYPLYRTIGKDPRPGNLEYYLLDGTQVLSQGMQFSLQGQYSLDMPQKSFKLRAKAAYGAKTFAAKLFDSRPYTEYKSFVLRDSGNDCVWTRINDAYQSELIDLLDTNVLHQAVNPVVVYLNGKYWGHYNMRERVDRYFVAQHEGISLDQAGNMDILESSGTVKWGSNKEYKAMIAKIKTLSPGKNPEDLKYITDRVDVDNYFDYMALEWFFGNSDAGNIRYYKLKGEGQKWRWIFYDSDYGMFNSKFDSPTSYMDPKGAGDQNVNNTLIRKLLENDEMKDRFLTRMGKIFQTLTTETMLNTFNTLADKIAPEMPLHFARWAELNEKTINADSPLTAEGAMRYWKTRLDRSRNVIKKRPNLFYGYVQKYFGLSDAQMTGYFGPKPAIPADALD